MSKRNRRHLARSTAPGGTNLKIGPVARIIASWLAAVATIAGVALGGRYGWEALAHFDKLAVKKIEVTGSVRALEPDVLAYAGVKLGDAMLNLDLDDIAMSLRRHPWIDQATVKRRLPDKVTIDIVEHEPAMIVALGSEAGAGVVDLYVANVRGELVKRATSDDHLDLPVLTGLSRELAARDGDAVHATVRDAAALAASAQKEASALGRVDEVRWDEALGWSLVTRITGSRAMTVHLGHDTHRALAVAVTTLARLSGLAATPRVIWADTPVGRTFIQARLEAPIGGDTQSVSSPLANAR